MSFTDVSKVLIYGKMRETWRTQLDQGFATDRDWQNDQRMMTSYDKLNQITSISKLNVIPSAGMKRLWVEGNRIKVKLSGAANNFYQYLFYFVGCP